MAHDISEYTRPLGPHSGYPWGDVQDDPGGTLVNRVMMGDWVQFFRKMVDAAGATPNGLDDNSTNGYQLYSALDQLINVPWIQPAAFTNNSGTGNVWGNAFGNRKFHCSVQGNKVFLAGIVKNTSGSSPLSTDILTLPVAARPAYATSFLAYSNSPTPGVIQFTVSTAGEITATTSCDNQVWFDGCFFKIGVDSY